MRHFNIFTNCVLLLTKHITNENRFIFIEPGNMDINCTFSP